MTLGVPLLDVLPPLQSQWVDGQWKRGSIRVRYMSEEGDSSEVEYISDMGYISKKGSICEQPTGGSAPTFDYRRCWEKQGVSITPCV